jgi:hypothetical protein
VIGPIVNVITAAVLVELRSLARRGAKAVVGALRRRLAPAEPKPQPLTYRDVKSIQSQIESATRHRPN